MYEKEIKRMEVLINEGRDFEAIPILNKIVGKPSLSLSDQLLLSSLLIRLGDWDNALKIAEQTYNEAQSSQNVLLSIKALLIMADASVVIGDLDKSATMIEKSEELYILLSKDKAKLEEIEAYKAYIKGFLSFYKGKKEDSLKYMRMSLNLREKIGNKRNIAESLLGMSNIIRMVNMDFDKAMYYTDQCLKIIDEIHYQRLKASAYFSLGSIYYLKGELEKTLSFYDLAAKYFKNSNDHQTYLGTLNNTANVYRAQGKLDKSIELLVKCINLSEDTKNNWAKVGFNVSMVEVYLDKDDITNAKVYSEKVKQLRDIENTPYINRDYKYVEALILKKSPRIQNRAKAENLFRSLIQDENTVSEIRIEGLIQVCDLLIDELKITGEMEIVEEIKPLINQLLILTEQSKSYWYYAQTYVLQAKLALLTFDIKTARQLLTKAQNIAEKYKFEPLVRKISSEHDDLLQKLDLWENLKDLESPLSDRLKLINLEDQVKVMIQKRRNEIPEAKDEEPIMILVISKGGIPTFSKLFVQTFIVEEDLICSFLAAFNTFSGELFSEGLDRASFGEFTLIMKPVAEFLICYIYRGQSFSAQKRMKNFVENLEMNNEVLDKFNEYQMKSQMIKLEDFPSLNETISKIFLN
jgi:tetratricopeptide (TPR) repeat protein